MKFTLPYPPTVNHYWGNRVAGKRVIRYIGAKGKQFRQDVIDSVSIDEPLTGSLKVSLIAYPPDKRKRDIDNLLKAPLDALQHAGIYADDNQINEINIIKGKPEKPGRLEVTICKM